MPADKKIRSGSTASGCSLCGTSLGYASLLLVCDHHLCLPCSAQTLEQHTTSSSVVRCRKCKEVTEVDERAAKYLASLRPDSPRTVTTTASASPNGDGSGSSAATIDVGRMSSPVRNVGMLDSSTASTIDLAKRCELASDRGREASENGARHAPSSYARAPIGYISNSCEENGSFPQFGAPSKAQPLSCHSPGREPRSASRSASPVNSRPFSCLSPTSRSNSRCGQCEDRVAELFCEQCTEVFCRSCSSSVHRRGKMAQHQLRPVREMLHPDVEKSADVARPITDNLVVLNRKLWACPYHPEDALQFVCLSCDSREVVCAECVLHGHHRGHDVQNIRDAAQRLPEEAAELEAVVQMRCDELRSISEHANEGRRQINMLVSQGKRELREGFEWLRSTLDEEEAAVLSEVSRCSQDVAEILTNKPEESSKETSLRELHALLRDHHQSGDAVMALNHYGRVKQRCNAPMAVHHALGGDMHVQLSGQLQRGFQARLAGIAAVAASFDTIRPLGGLRLSGHHVPTTSGTCTSNGPLSPSRA